MFRQGSGPGLRALIFLLLSIALIIVDERSVSFHVFRTRFSSVVAYPFQWVVDAPIRFAEWLNDSVTSQQHLLAENEELKVQQVLLQSRLQKLLALEQENTQLRQLLQSTSQIAGRVKVARLLAVALDPNLQEVVLNKGAKADVYAGQPVLDAFGVMGQVISVGALTSKILLITDRQSAVPVEDYRNGIRAVATGLGTSGRLVLTNVPNQSDIQPGDLFVTSGLGLCYPVGYPVGVVTEIKPRKHEFGQKIVLTPTAHLDQTEQVLLSWPDKSKLSQAVQKELQSMLSPATSTDATTQATTTKKGTKGTPDTVTLKKGTKGAPGTVTS